VHVLACEKNHRRSGFKSRPPAGRDLRERSRFCLPRQTHGRASSKERITGPLVKAKVPGRGTQTSRCAGPTFFARHLPSGVCGLLKPRARMAATAIGETTHHASSWHPLATLRLDVSSAAREMIVLIQQVPKRRCAALDGSGLPAGPESAELFSVTSAQVRARRERETGTATSQKQRPQARRPGP
jgi:hypothetical protein